MIVTAIDVGSSSLRSEVRFNREIGDIGSSSWRDSIKVMKLDVISKINVLGMENTSLIKVVFTKHKCKHPRQIL